MASLQETTPSARRRARHRRTAFLLVDDDNALKGKIDAALLNKYTGKSNRDAAMKLKVEGDDDKIYIGEADCAAGGPRCTVISVERFYIGEDEDEDDEDDGEDDGDEFQTGEEVVEIPTQEIERQVYASVPQEVVPGPQTHTVDEDVEALRDLLGLVRVRSRSILDLLVSGDPTLENAVENP